MDYRVHPVIKHGKGLRQAAGVAFAEKGAVYAMPPVMSLRQMPVYKTPNAVGSIPS